MSPLEQLQLFAAGRLNSEAYFHDITVTVLRPRAAETAIMIQTKLDQVLAGLIKKDGKGGVACSVLMPTGTSPEGNLPGPALDLGFTVRVIENPLLNMSETGTQKSCEEIAIEVMDSLHHWTPGVEGVGVVVADKQALRPRLDFAPKLVYDVGFTARSNRKSRARCAPVAFSTAGDDTTLIATEEGATIWYSTDESYPYADNPTATLYAAPLSGLPVGTVLYAVAYAEGRAPSNPTALVF